MRTYRIFGCLFLIFAMIVPPMPESALASSDTPKKSKRVNKRKRSSILKVDGSEEKSEIPATIKLEHDEFSFRGARYKVEQVRNAEGVIVEQRVYSPNRIQLAFDSNGDGTWDSWESHTPKRRMVFKEPENGHFVLMEMEQVTRAGVARLKFIRRPDGLYHLYQKKIDRNLRMSRVAAPSDFVIGVRKSEEGVLERHANQLSAFFKETSEEEAKRTIYDKIMDNSCKTPEWDSNKNVRDAIYEVFKSDDPKTQPNLEATTGSQPLYLACLRKYKMGAHASRIAAAMQTYNTQNPYKWNVACKDADAPMIPGEVQRGEYFYRVGAPPTIFFTKDKRGGNTQCDVTTDDFAKTFFHEMLHYSLIQDEKVVGTIEGCCTQTSAAAPACNDLRAVVKRRETTQKIERALVEKLGPEEFQRLTHMIDSIYGGDSYEKMQELYEGLAAAAEIAASDPKYNTYCAETDKKCIEARAEVRRVLVAEQANIAVSYVFGKEECSAKLNARLIQKVRDEGGVLTLTEDVRAAIQKEVDRVCSAASGAIASKVIPGGKNVCRDGEIAKATDTLPKWRLPAPIHLFTSTTAFAVASNIPGYNASDYDSLICGGTNVSMTWDDWRPIRREDYNYNPIDVVGSIPSQPGVDAPNEQYAKSPSQPGTPQITVPGLGTKTPKPNQSGAQPEIPKDRTSGDSGETVVGGGGSSGGKKHVGFSRETQGPPTFDYASSSSPSQRAQEITRSLRVENEVESRVARYLDPVLPKAQASVAEKLKENLRLPDPFSSGGGVASNQSSGSQSVSMTAGLTAPAAIKATTSPVTPSPKAPGGAGGESSSPRQALPVGVSSSASGSKPNRGVAGLSASPSPTAVPIKKDEADPRLVRAFLSYLQNIERNTLKRELGRPSVIRQLNEYLVAVIDDEGSRFGPVDKAKHWLIYDSRYQRLVLREESVGK